MNIVKKIVVYAILLLSLISIGYIGFVYYVPYSEGVRSGELIKISHKGFIVNTDKIQSFSSTVVTVNGQKIPVSKTYKDIVFNSLQHSPLKQ